MILGDLTTLASVKNWLGSDKFANNTNADAMLAALITRKSQDVCAYLERPYILPFVYSNEVNSGMGRSRLFFRNWPVTSVASLYVNGVSIPYQPLLPAQSPFAFGYRYELWDGVPPGGSQQLLIVGGSFGSGIQNVLTTYTAGYQVTDEPQKVPTGSAPTITVNETYGIWGSDQGVKYASTGVPFTKVSATPTLAGQYQVATPDVGNPANPTGQYIFAPADNAANVLISYGFIPRALEQVVIEIIAERYLYRSHIGEVSRTVGGQVTLKYDNAGIPHYAMATLQRYKLALPI